LAIIIVYFICIVYNIVYIPPVDLGETATRQDVRHCGGGCVSARHSAGTYLYTILAVYGGGVVPSPKFFILLSFYLFPLYPPFSHTPWRQYRDLQSAPVRKHHNRYTIATIPAIPIIYYYYYYYCYYFAYSCSAVATAALGSHIRTSDSNAPRRYVTVFLHQHDHAGPRWSLQVSCVVAYALSSSVVHGNTSISAYLRRAITIY